MSPKVKITKEDIINAALNLVRKSGVKSLNARAIAAFLKSSTQPIFSNFATMDELQSAVILAAYGKYLDFLNKESESNKYPKYKAFGMAYIRFAKEEKELFKLLFMRDRKGEGFVATFDFETSVEMIMSANGISKEKAERIHFETWMCVHGIATIIATSFLELDWDSISDMLTDVYMGIRAKHISEEK